MKRVVLFLVIGYFLVGWLSTQQALAIPAFARHEGVSCQYCHYRMPELNTEGVAYLRRGLRMPALGAAPAAPTPGTTPPAGKTPAATGELGEPLSLDWANYLSAIGHPNLTLQRGARPAWGAGGIDLWLAGPLDQHWTGLVNPSFDADAGISSVGPAYAQYITSWSDHFGSLRAGQTVPFAIDLNQGGASMALSAPLVLSMPGDTGTGWTPATLVRGAEVGFVSQPRWNAYVGIGQPNLGLSPDTVSHPDLYASADYLFGDQGNSLTAYGYWGQASLTPGEGKFHRLGAFANFYLSRGKLVAGYLQGKDDTGDGRSLDNRGAFLLAEWLLTDRWAIYGRYDTFTEDLDAGGSQTFNGPTLGITWWMQSQIRVTTEAQYLNSTGNPQSRSLTTELLWSF